jgi:hypothetical protein
VALAERFGRCELMKQREEKSGKHFVNFFTNSLSGSFPQAKTSPVGARMRGNGFWMRDRDISELFAAGPRRLALRVARLPP